MSQPDLISQLAENLKPVRPPSRGRQLALFAGIGGACFFLLCLVFPMREDLVQRFHDPIFAAEAAAWALCALLAGKLYYDSLFPGTLNPKRARWVALPIFVLGVLSLTHLHPANGFSAEFWQEMDLYRGRCGFIIVLLASTTALALVVWARKEAPTLRVTGPLLFLTTGSLGGLLMQFVCTHENTLHLMIWHLLPIFILLRLGWAAGARLLKW